MLFRKKQDLVQLPTGTDVVAGSVRQSIKSMLVRDAFGDQADEPDVVPSLMIFGHLEAKSAKEAEKFVRSLAEKRATIPVAIGYALMPFGKGFAYEIQEGGQGFSFLPQIVEQSKIAPPGSRLYGRSQERIVEVTVRPQSLQCLVLPESAPGLPEGEVDWLVASKRKLKPLIKTGMPIFMGGVFLFCFSLAALSAVGGVFAFMSRTPQIPPVVMPYSSLPIEQWPLLTADTTKGRYVQALHWQNGTWQIVWSPEQESVEGLVKTIVDQAVAKVAIGDDTPAAPDSAVPPSPMVPSSSMVSPSTGQAQPASPGASSAGPVPSESEVSPSDPAEPLPRPSDLASTPPAAPASPSGAVSRPRVPEQP